MHMRAGVETTGELAGYFQPFQKSTYMEIRRRKYSGRNRTFISSIHALEWDTKWNFTSSDSKLHLVSSRKNWRRREEDKKNESLKCIRGRITRWARCASNFYVSFLLSFFSLYTQVPTPLTTRPPAPWHLHSHSITFSRILEIETPIETRVRNLSSHSLSFSINPQIPIMYKQKKKTNEERVLEPTIEECHRIGIREQIYERSTYMYTTPYTEINTYKVPL